MSNIDTVSLPESESAPPAYSKIDVSGAGTLNVPNTSSAAAGPVTAPVKSQTKPKEKKNKFSLKSKVKDSKAPKSTKPTWMDASLSDEERWKDWHKAKDRERTGNGTTGFFTSFYKKNPIWGFSLFM